MARALPRFATGRIAPLRRSRGRPDRGFTLLELMVAISMITILMAIAIPTYNHSILVARESVLRSDLDTLRNAITQYTLDKQKGLQSLDDLKMAGYIDNLPEDPMTRQANWEVEQGEVMLSIEQQDTGITDVHSASTALASNGEAYNTW